uniref:Delta-9 desaturase n=1 Tax=Brachionus koreanus TaxID=1199090 RepID=A0A291LM90_9BILA|nr:delta-9 desaturase [Brachionus koreanus]QBO56257.1 fatty acid desaturase 9 [Brachionus koreanus]
MAPRIDGFNVPEKIDDLQKTTTQAQSSQLKKEGKLDLPIRWRNVAVFAALHVGALYGIYLCFYAKIQTLIFSYLLYLGGALGITAGAHRLWSHRTYKAKLPLRIFLGMMQTLALQNSIFEWSRDHRVHHKHAETNADPHNSKRGFFFAHMGWLLMKKHPDVIQKGSRIPLDDLLADPVVAFQKKYYKTLAIFTCFVLPTVIPVFWWNESWTNAYFVPAILRYIVTLHFTWFVNSFAHMWGMRPYDKKINPAENLFVSMGAIGEGFHNYHHTFPMDYSTSEHGSVYFNFTKFFIDFMALIGQAYDRNKVSPAQILARRKRTGDLSRQTDQEDEVEHEHDY